MTILRGVRPVVMLELACIVLLVGIVAVLLVSRDDAFDVRGSVVVDQPSDASSAVPCSRGGTYGDLAAGAPVTIRSEVGDVLATGSLGAGSPDRDGQSCTFGFQVTEVRDGERLYQVQVAGRGAMPFDRDGLTDGPVLTLGRG